MIRGVATGRYRAYVAPASTSSTSATSLAATSSRSSSGRPGERYLLGGVDLSLGDVFAVVAELAG